MSVSAIIVTRGDVDMGPILKSLPNEWEKIVWENGRKWKRMEPGAVNDRDPDWRHWSGGLNDQAGSASDLSVYGRYAAIQYASHDLVFTQDDDCIVSDPQSIVRAWQAASEGRPGFDALGETHVAANMPPRFRHDFYQDHCLVGFGSCFHRNAPDIAFSRFGLSSYANGSFAWGTDGQTTEVFDRTCDVIFTTLTPRVLVDVPVEVLPYAHDDNRMWKQPNHVSERTQVLEMARKVRDA